MLQNEMVNHVDWDDHVTLHGSISWLAEVAEKKCLHFLRGTGYERGLSPEEMDQIRKSYNWLKAIKERHSALMQEYEKKAKDYPKPEPTAEDIKMWIEQDKSQYRRKSIIGKFIDKIFHRETVFEGTKDGH